MLFVSRLPWFCEIMPLGRTQLTRMPGLRPRQARIEPAPRKKAQGGHLFHREGADLPRRSPGCRPWGLPSSRLPAPLCSLATSDLQTRTAAHRKWPRRANKVLSASHQAQAVSSGRWHHSRASTTKRRAAASGERGDQDSQGRAGSNSSPGASTSRGTACYTAAGSTTTTTRGSGERGKQ